VAVLGELAVAWSPDRVAAVGQVGRPAPDSLVPAERPVARLGRAALVVGRGLLGRAAEAA
jgi:hypothetical protein